MQIRGAVTALMAATSQVDHIYMKVDGVDGQVNLKGFEKWIEVNDISYGWGRSVAMDQTSRRTVSPPSFSELCVAKDLDDTTVKLGELAWGGDNGGYVKQVEVAFIKTTQQQKEPLVVQKITLGGKVAVSRSDVASSNLVVTNNVCFAYSEIKVQGTQKNVNPGYDIETNKIA